MATEKQVCHLRATFRATGGHASLATQHNPMTKVAQFLQRAISDPRNVRGRNNVPGHRQTCLAACPCRNSRPVQSTIHGLDVETDGRQGPYTQPIVPKYRHSQIATGGDRILPNLSPELLMSELRGIAGPASEIEVLSHDSGLQRPDLGLFETLSDVLKESDADGIPVPMLMPAATDGRLFARLGIQTYGFCHQHWISLRSSMAPMSVPQWMPSTLEQTRFTACCKGMDAPPRLGVGMPYFV